MDETMTTETEYPQVDWDREVMHALADEAYETLVNAAHYDTEA
jgi:hypothetical protein